MRLLKVIFVAMLVLLGFYWLLWALIPPEHPTFPPEVVKFMSWFACAFAGAVLVLRFGLIPNLLSQMAPDDIAKSQAKLRTYHVLCYSLSNGIGFVGLALRLMGASRKETLPFFLGAAVLFALCYPRLPAEDRNHF